MAISTIKATIQMRKGLEQDFDPDKMTAGEWAVSTDNKYVRMCFAPGVCLRMATYESFEEDMKEIQNILATCQDIQIAVDAMAKLAEQHKYESLEYANLSKSYAVGTNGEVRDGDATDNSKYYYEQAKRISQGMNGLIPMGTVAFENLPTTNITKNAMYNVSNAFTSDERFLDGGGLNYGAGNNVYYTADGKWDVLAASSVTGVKGAKEDSYRQGNVNITPDNIGALATDGDSKDNTVTFTSGDSTDLDKWEDVDIIASGEKHSSIFAKISTMFKNIRYLHSNALYILSFDSSTGTLTTKSSDYTG